MGCIARLGCLFVLVIGGIIGWFTRDRWLPEQFRSHSAVASNAVWRPVTSDGAVRTRVALEKLSQPRGQVFQTLPASDLASYAFAELSKRLPASADSVETMVSGESISVRANVRLADLGGSAAHFQNR
jgi:hypothetical protein